MFVFVEGCSANLNTLAEFPYTRENVETPLSFNEAVILLAQNSKPINNSVTIFKDFFSVGCSNLLPEQIRGLERIALGENSVEIFEEGTRHTRFITPIPLNVFRTHPYVLNSIARDSIGFGIGSFRRRNILIVGESPGKNSFGFNTPFVGSGSGIWLLKQLEDAEIQEDDLYWINAKNGFGDTATQDFIEKLFPRRIITLGNIAKEWASNLADKFEVIHSPHPQYWRRFKSKQPYPFLQLLKP